MRALSPNGSPDFMLKRLPPTVLLTLSTLFWGGNFVVGRWAHTAIGPLSLSFWRWFLSAVILSPFVIPGIWRHRGVIRENFAILFVLALVGMVIFHSFTYIALNTSEAINAAVVLASMPMVIPLVSFIARDERLNARQVLGIVISLTGVAVIIARGQLSVLLNLSFAAGDLWVLGAVVAWSVYSVLLKRAPKVLPPLVLLGITNMIAVVILFPFYLWEYKTKGGFDVTVSTLMVLAYVSLFASIAAFMCWNAAVPRIGANKAGLFINLIPLFAAVFSIIFLGETLKTYHIIGIVPIVAGIYLTASAKAKVKPCANEEN